jgi:hypothetical protein
VLKVCYFLLNLYSLFCFKIARKFAQKSADFWLSFSLKICNIPLQKMNALRHTQLLPSIKSRTTSRQVRAQVGTASRKPGQVGPDSKGWGGTEFAQIVL